MFSVSDERTGSGLGAAGAHCSGGGAGLCAVCAAAAGSLPVPAPPAGLRSPAETGGRGSQH